MYSPGSALQIQAKSASYSIRARVTEYYIIVTVRLGLIRFLWQTVALNFHFVISSFLDAVCVRGRTVNKYGAGRYRILSGGFLRGEAPGTYNNSRCCHRSSLGLFSVLVIFRYYLRTGRNIRGDRLNLCVLFSNVTSNKRALFAKVPPMYDFWMGIFKIFIYLYIYIKDK